DQSAIHGLIRGWSCRVLLEQGAMDRAELYRRARLALSPALPLSQAGAWIEGLLRGSGMVVLHQDGLWEALDEWISYFKPETFIEMLPPLRRAFADFQPPERRAMGEKLKRLRPRAGQALEPPNQQMRVNRDRAELVLPLLAQVLGTTWPPKASLPAGKISE